jgi:hypothetical protein
MNRRSFITARLGSDFGFLRGSIDEPDYNDGDQNEHPVGNLNARYRCCPAKPFHDLPPRWAASVSGI